MMRAEPITKGLSGRDVVGHLLRFGERSGLPLREASQNERLIASGSGYVYRCAEINANRVASTPIKGYRKTRSRSQRSRRIAARHCAELVARKRAGLDVPIAEIIDTMPWPGRPISRAKRRWLDGECKAGSRPMRPSASVIAKATAIRGDVEEVDSHPLLGLLGDPNRDENGLDLIYLAQLYMELCGRAYWAKIGPDGGPPNRLRTMPPHMMDILPDPDGTESIIDKLIFSPYNQPIEFDPADVVMFRVPSPLDMLGALGPAEAGWEVVALQAGIRQAQRAVFERGGMVDFVMFTTGAVNVDSQKKAQAAWRQKFQGVRNWFKNLMILSDTTKIERISEKPRDLMFADADALILKAVSIQFGVPLSMLTTEGGNKLGETTNAQQGSDDYSINTLAPRCVRFEQTLNTQLVPDFGDDVFLAFDPPFTEDENSQQRRTTERVSTGQMTINEARKDMGLAPVEGGDEPRVNGAALSSLDIPQVFGGFGRKPLLVRPSEPIQTDKPDESGDMQTPDQPDQLADLALNGAQIQSLLEVSRQVAAGELPSEAALEIIAAAFPTISADRIDRLIASLDAFAPGDEGGGSEGSDEPSPPAPTEPAPTEQRSLWSDVTDAEVERVKSLTWPDKYGKAVEHDSPFRDPTEEAFVSDLAEELDRQTTDAAGLLRAGGDAASAFSPEPILAIIAAFAAREALDGFNAGIEQLLDAKPSLGEPASDAGAGGGSVPPPAPGAAAGADEGGPVLSVAFDIDDPRVQDFIRRRQDVLRERAAEVTATHADEITGVIDMANAAGLTPDEIGDEIERISPDISTRRAVMIARTETAFAHSEATVNAWQTSGVVNAKQWLLAPNACEFCRTLKDRTIPLDANFHELGDTVIGVRGGRLSVNFTPIAHPPLHPNCRCDMIAVIAGGDETQPLQGTEGNVGDPFPEET